MPETTISLALTGSGGAGVVITGQLLLRAAGKAGFYGFMHRSAGPQIRGGESLAMLRLSHQPVESLDDGYCLLCALDWKNFDQFSAEVPLGAASFVLADEKAGALPGVLAGKQNRFMRLPLGDIAGSVEGGRPNMVLVGQLGRFLHIPVDLLRQEAQLRLRSKGDAVVNPALACIEAGYEMSLDINMTSPYPPASPEKGRWFISGNESAALGALHAGIRFVAGYPITPASDALEWLAPKLESVGGRLVQAEDELASINMVIGASWGGVPSLTATSGPGLALMTESLGLAVASETPVTVLNVMRGGPSTGIPTKSEQSDLDIALHGLHGDAPHLVTAPLSIGDCAFTTAWTVGLTEHLQAPAIILSDQSLGQSQAVTSASTWPPAVQRRRAADGVPAYQRYRHNDDGVSPVAIPGDYGNMYTADGLEHNEAGTPSSRYEDHLDGLNKRAGKLNRFDYGKNWGRVEGGGDIAILAWGSVSAAVTEAARRLQTTGKDVRTICIRLLAPLQEREILKSIDNCRRIIVVEQTHGQQFLRYLRSVLDFDVKPESLAHPGPLPVRPGEIVRFVQRGE